MFILASAVANVAVTVQPICDVVCRAYAILSAPRDSPEEIASRSVPCAEDDARTVVRGESSPSIVNAPRDSLEEIALRSFLCSEYDARTVVQGPVPPSDTHSYPPTPSSSSCSSPSSIFPPTPTDIPSALLTDATVAVIRPSTSEDAATAHDHHEIPTPTKRAYPPSDFVDSPQRRAQMRSYARAAAQSTPTPASKRRSGLRSLLLPRQHGLPDPAVRRRKSGLRPLMLPRRAGLQ